MNKNHLLFLAAFVLLFFLAGFIPSGQFSAAPGLTDTTPITIKAKDYNGKTVQSTSGVISFISALDNDFYLIDSVNRQGYLYLEIRAGKLVQAQSNKVPVNLSIVIDRSGSMRGEKMEFAIKAAKEIVDKLTERDFVSIVAYDDEADIIQPAVQVINKKGIKQKIEEILPRGSTNLWGGSEIGYYQVLKKYKPGFINRVLVISDGLANRGITSASAIKMHVQRFKNEEGVSLSTFGVGLDYNEILMTEMAEVGEGNYYFIDAPDKMAVLFDRELKELKSVTALNAELSVQLPREVTIQKAYHLKYEANKSAISIHFRDLFSGETKGILLAFRVNDAATAALRFVSTIRYTDVVSGQKKSIVNENLLHPVTITDTFLTHFNRSVAEQTVLFTANENLEKAMLEADKGNFEKAFQTLNANKTFLKHNELYVKAYTPLQKMDSVNNAYFTNLAKVKEMGNDSIKLLQKSSRAEAYKIRNKKH